MKLRDQINEIKPYIDGIYNTVVVKDIATRKKISYISMLEGVTKFMFDNIGNQLL